MYVAPLSPVLEESLKRPEKPSVSILQTADATSLKYVFVEKVIDALLRDEKILVVVDDEEDLSLPVKLLSNHRLGHLCLAWNNSDHLGDAQLERFQILKGLKPLDDPSRSFDHLQIQRRSIERKIVESLHLLNRARLGDLSLKSIIQKRNHKKDHLHAWSPDVHTHPNEVNQVLDALQSLQQHWQDRFGVWQSLNILSNAVFKDPALTDETLCALRDLRDESKALSGDLESLLAAAQQRIRDRIWEEYDVWRNATDELLELYYSQEIEQRFAHWEEAVERISQHFIKTDYLCFDALDIGYFDWDQTLDNAEKINLYLSDHEKLIEHYTTEYFKRLTPFNSDDPELMLVVDRVKKFANKLADQDHHNLKMESDVLLIQILRQSLLTICEDLENACRILTDQAYLDYKKIQAASGLSDEAIRYLSDISDQSWDRNYIQCVFNVMARKGFDPELRLLNQKMEKFAILSASRAAVLNQEIHNRWCKQKDSGLHHIEYHNSDLNKILFETRQTTLSVSNIYFNDAAFLQSFYPVVCIRNKHIGEILSNSHASWHHMFFLNTKELPFIDFAVESTEITIASSHSLPIEDLMKDYPVRYFYAAERRPDFTRPFSLLSRSEKYHQALQLATCLLSVIERFVVFHLGDTCCISLLNEDLHKAFVQQLPTEQLNFLYDGNNDIDPLIEALIHPESRVHILVENQLINDGLPECLEWQMAVLKWLNQAGVAIHSINTHEIYENAEGAFAKCINKLVKSQPLMDETEYQESNASS